jgi:putative nucleotidyltransferase with HDIG domain
MSATRRDKLDLLLEIIHKIGDGDYSNDIMPLTGDTVPEPLRSIAEAVGMMTVKIKAREYHQDLLIEELQGLNEQIRRNTVKTVEAMAQALEARDASTRGHAERVGLIAAEIAREMGVAEAIIETVRIGGILHDIGKIKFTDRLFQANEGENPPGMIKEITRHPTTGAEILKDLDFLGDALEFIHAHHEQPDGKGYPRRMEAPDIPLGARIIAVADGYDAMTTDRPYQKAISSAAALEILRNYRGTKWDSECVAAFERVLARLTGRDVT